MTPFQKLAVATTTATFLLIGLGGFVRAAGAGLGCPDWPKCFGRWIPPTEVSQLPADIDPELFNFRLAWIEYVNRLVGVAVGLLILATAWLAWRDHRGDRPVLVPALAAVPLVAFQGWFGGQVVAYELDPRLVTVHLLGAVAIIAVLIAAAANSFPRPVRGETADRTRQFRLVRAALVLVLLQICLGALVRGSIDLAVERFPDLERGALLAEAGWLDGAHRTLGLAVLACCAAVALASARASGRTPVWRRPGMAPLAIASVQFTAGAGLAWFSLPPALQVVHVLFASLLFGSLFLLALRLRAG